jgi:hypothetical protein
MTVFHLGRMRHLDLLAVWHRLNPGGREQQTLRVARLCKENLIAAILSP